MATRIKTDSSMLSWVEFAEEDNAMLVCFRSSGNIYKYENITYDQFVELTSQKTDSIGKWMFENIISNPLKHPHTRLKK